jgi:hypothetical protein
MRFTMTGRAIAGALALVWLAGATPFAQQPRPGFTPARTPDGQPDIQGIWVNFDATPFESSGPGRRLSEINPPEHWADHDSPVSARRFAMVVDPPDGLLPILPAAEALRDSHFAQVNDHWAHETPWVRCITRGIPGGMFPAQYNNGLTIHQAPGYVVIIFEMVHDARIIPLNGGTHVGSGVRLWNGDARGHWEGTTLVVETTNFNGKGMMATSAAGGRLRGVAQSAKTHVVERFTPLDANTIKYEVTVTDADNFSKPFTIMMPLNRDEKYLMVEYGCHEGNLSLPNMLNAGRVAEAEAAKTK